MSSINFSPVTISSVDVRRPLSHRRFPAVTGRVVREPEWRTGFRWYRPPRAARARRRGSSSAGERVVLADLDGPGHDPPHLDDRSRRRRPSGCARYVLEVFYDDAREPSVVGPVARLLRPAARAAGRRSRRRSRRRRRAEASTLPPDAVRAPRARRVHESVGAARRRSTTRSTTRSSPTFPPMPGYLHVAFRRENPTMLRRDFVIAEASSGRAASSAATSACAAIDGGCWYGEGEVKVYRDGDARVPDDLRHRARGLRRQRVGHGRAPRAVRRRAARRRGRRTRRRSAMPDFVGFYRWHLPDPIMFARDCAVTIQQIGMHLFLEGQEEEREQRTSSRTRWPAGDWFPPRDGCWRWDCSSASTTTAPRRSSTASERSRCPASMRWPPPPIWRGNRTNGLTNSRDSWAE